MKKVLSIFVAALSLAAVAAVPKSSAVTGATLPYNAPVRSIPLSHTINNASGHVHTGFTFALTPSEDNPAIVGGYNATNIASVNTDANPNTKQVVADCTLSLQNLYFYKVGNYTFTISETASSDELNFPHDSENKYDIYFQVTNKLDANNEPTGELAVSLLDQMYSHKEDAKVSLNARFDSIANYTYISLQNKVTGAGADSDKYFKYKVSFENLPENSTLTVTGQDEEVEYAGETIQTAGTQNPSEGDVYVYLKHGQTATIGNYATRAASARELPQGVSYTIEKVDSDDGYGASMDNSEVTTVTKTVAPIDSEDFATHNVTIAGNSKDATVNTGVFAASWPFLLAASLGLTGFIIFRCLSRAS